MLFDTPTFRPPKIPELSLHLRVRSRARSLRANLGAPSIRILCMWMRLGPGSRRARQQPPRMAARAIVTNLLGTAADRMSSWLRECFLCEGRGPLQLGTMRRVCLQSGGEGIRMDDVLRSVSGLWALSSKLTMRGHFRVFAPRDG